MIQMRHSNVLSLALSCIIGVLAPVSASQADVPSHDAFTYQGQLRQNGEPVTEAVDLKFRLYDAEVAGEQVGDELVAAGYDDFNDEGRFTIDLAFGKSVFDGTALWLEIEVDGVTLSPRQPIMPAPYSVRALNVATVADDALGGTYTGQLNFNNAGNQFTGAFAGSGTGLTDLNASNISSGTLGSTLLSGSYTNAVSFGNAGNAFNGFFNGTFTGNGAGLSALNANSISSGTLNIARMPTGGNWSLSSTLNLANSTLVVNPANGHVGIGTNSPEAPLHVAEGTSGTGLILPGLRVFQNDTSPNVIGGSSGNEVGAVVVGATIGGGGRLEFGSVNRVLNNYGTVSGGLNNNSSGEHSTVSGGFLNTASGSDSTVGGGRNNNATGFAAIVGGGQANIASGSRSIVGSGSFNRATSNHSTVGGGSNNHATESGATVGGGRHNRADSDDSIVAGGNSNTASGNLSTISGGWNNTASGSRATVPGGNLNVAGGDYSFAAGRRAKVRTADQADNTTGDQGTFIWADSTNADFTSTGNNQFLIRASGGVGIGTNAPRQQLSIGADLDLYSGSTNSPTRPSVRGSGNDNLVLSAANDGDVYFNFDGGSGGVRFHGGEGVGLRMRLTPEGLLGIGTSNPDFLLHVNGDAGKPGGGSWSNASDIRLKHNIQPLSHSLDRLLALDGVTYEYIDPDSIHELPGQRIGMIAQQVAEVFPDWVNEADDGYLRLTYRGFEAIVVEALRELRSKKDAEIAALHRRNDELEARLTELERLLHGVNGAVQP